jgi:aspartate kinase
MRMSIIVQKYGGSSLATPTLVEQAARQTIRLRQRGESIVVVVSAAGDVTDMLLQQARSYVASPAVRELDMLLATGEQASAALFAMALHACGYTAVAYTGAQAGIRTDRRHGSARINRIDTKRIQRDLSAGRIVVVAGFQGLSETNDITTLGRGGSDTSAVALAVALHAERCEILTDVDGVYTCDPRVVATARRLEHISYEEMRELAATGAQVVHPRAVEIALEHAMPLLVRESHNDGPGTLIVGACREIEASRVCGVALQSGLGSVSVFGVMGGIEGTAALFAALAAAGIIVDDVTQEHAESGEFAISFTVSQSDLARVKAVIEACSSSTLCEPGVQIGLARVSLIGRGLRGQWGIAARAMEVLAESGVRAMRTAATEARVSLLIDGVNATRAAQVLHDAFCPGRDDQRAAG